MLPSLSEVMRQMGVYMLGWELIGQTWDAVKAPGFFVRNKGACPSARCLCGDAGDPFNQPQPLCSWIRDEVRSAICSTRCCRLEGVRWCQWAHIQI